MKRLLICVLPICAIFAGGVPALAQRDFLTSDEIEKVRDAQAPNDRLKLYTLFARQRLDQLQRLLEKEKKGRSQAARELLEDYSSIIDAIDTVSDDALARGVNIAEGMTAVTDSEKRFLGQLQKIRDRNPADIDLYEIALKEAMASTSDSMDLAAEDTGSRTAKLNAEDKRVKEEAKQTIAAEDSKGKPTPAGADRDAKNGDANPDDAKPARKPPTLLRPGEKLPDQ